MNGLRNFWFLHKNKILTIVSISIMLLSLRGDFTPESSEKEKNFLKRPVIHVSFIFIAAYSFTNDFKLSVVATILYALFNELMDNSIL